MHGREDGRLAELASADLDLRPRHDADDAVSNDRPRKVIPHRGAVWQVDRCSFSDRKEWPEAEIGDALDIAFRVTVDVLIDGGLDPGSHGKTVAVVGYAVNADASVRCHQATLVRAARLRQ